MSNEYIIQRRIKHQKLRRKARRGEIAIRRIYKFIRFLFILFIFYSAYRIIGAHYWYFNSDLYTENTGKYIEILGNNIVSDEKIINEMKKFSTGKTPIYMTNPAKMARQIEQLAPIKRVYIRRYWLPARYVLMIEEVIPAIVISPSEEAPAVAAFAHSGEFIGREYLPFDNEKCNTVKILSYGTKGDDYEKWDSEKINNLYTLAKLLEEYSGEKLEYIDLRNPHNAFAQIESSKIKLGEIDISVYERIKSIHEILPAVKQLNLKTKYIDLSWKEAKYIKEDKQDK